MLKETSDCEAKTHFTIAYMVKTKENISYVKFGRQFLEIFFNSIIS